ncbi:hypothetical protein WJX84_005358 [Apatococcus fuscideae]|uniref:Uncharacterized protein n=1 Tax=Apatococcus fuscideae TaxID=2026836 RepID=A0AAW1SUU5_9CHLO
MREQLSDREPFHPALQITQQLIYIHGKAYDVSHWSTHHPGGSLVFDHWAGKDATEPFTAFHPPAVRKRLRSLQGLFDTSWVFYAGTFLWAGALLSLGIWAAWHAQTTVAALSVALFWQQMAFVGHDAGHNAISHNRFIDGILGLIITSSVGIGLSWWKHTHNSHHTCPNSLDCDPDIQFMPLIAIDERYFESVKSRHHNATLTFDSTARRLISYQHFTFIPLLMFAKWGLYNESCKQLLWNRAYIHRPSEVFAQVFFFSWYFALAAQLPSAASRTAFILLSHAAFFLLHLQICLSHFAAPTFLGTPHAEEGWVALQVRGTINWSCPAWLDWLHGGLQFQIEHHLFPRMPRHHLRKASPHVQALCLELGLPYHMPTFFGAIRETFGRLRRTALVARSIKVAPGCARLGLASILLIISKAAGLVAPFYFKRAIDCLGESAAKASIGAAVTALLWSGLCRVINGLAKEIQHPIFTPVSQAAGRRVAYHTFSHVLELDLAFHLERRTGTLTRILERGTRAVAMVFRAVVFTFIPTFVELVLVCGLLARTFRPLVSLMVVATFVAYVAWTLYMTSAATEARKRVLKLDNLYTNKAVDALLNYETVKLFNNEALEVSQYDEYLVGYQKASVENEKIYAGLNGGQSVILALGLTGVLIAAATSAGTFTAGDLVMAQGLLLQLWGPLSFLGWFYRELRQSLVDMEQFFGILSQTTNLPDGTRDLPTSSMPSVSSKSSDSVPAMAHDRHQVSRPAASLNRANGHMSSAASSKGLRVEMKDVKFAYNSGRDVLRGISLTIEPGQSVAFVGGSGSGKSTVLKLLMRLYDVSSGTVCVNGLDVRELKQSSFRSAVAVVPQDTVLFNDTILRNVAYGRPQASNDEIVQAAEMARLGESIGRMPEGYNTMAGERGLKLSGGEKSRVAIARAFLRNPRLLICDEATAALDTVTEQAIMRSLNELAEGRTCIYVAHRLSTIQGCDKIVVMSEGRVAEMGSHEELMAAGHVYFDMRPEKCASEAESGVTIAGADLRDDTCQDLQPAHTAAVLLGGTTQARKRSRANIPSSESDTLTSISRTPPMYGAMAASITDHLMKAKKKTPMSETTTREIQAAIEALQRALNATCNKVDGGTEQAMLLAKFSAVKQEAAEEARGRAAAEAELVDLQFEAQAESDILRAEVEAAKADAAEKMPVIAQLARELGCAIVVGFAENRNKQQRKNIRKQMKSRFPALANKAAVMFPGLPEVGGLSSLTRDMGWRGHNEDTAILAKDGQDQDTEKELYSLKFEDLKEVALLGRGSSGVVRKVHHGPTGKDLVLKVIQFDTRQEQLRKQVSMELRTLAEANHPSIVKFYQSFLNDGAVVIVMEHMDAGSMADVLHRHRSIAEPYLAQIALQAVQGLQYLHKDRRIIHRDIKPSNLLMSSVGRLKIADFGVSGQLANSVSKCQTWVGTVTYMSPERIKGDAYGFASDSWSLGLSLLEFALGHFPYAPPGAAQGVGLSFWELMDFIVAASPPQLSPGEWSPDFCDFLDRCLQKDPKLRVALQQRKQSAQTGPKGSPGEGSESVLQRTSLGCMPLEQTAAALLLF